MTRRKVVQYVSLGDDSDETKGHGTHVAGTAAGQRASDGISESPGEVDGIAPGAKLSFVDLGVAGEFDANSVVLIKVESNLTLFFIRIDRRHVILGQDTLNIPFPPSSIYEHGLRAGSKIHSSSWGIGYNHYGAGERDLDTFMVDNPDVLIVLAAGNSGDTPNAVGSPATCKNALSGESLRSSIFCCQLMALFLTRA
jgi:subtilisin family serine protease